MPAVMIEEEKAYPIYRVRASWQEDNKNPEFEGQPARINNGTSFTWMLEDEPSQEELNEKVREWWKNTLLLEDNKIRNASDFKFSVEFKEYEV